MRRRAILLDKDVRALLLPGHGAEARPHPRRPARPGGVPPDRRRRLARTRPYDRRHRALAAGGWTRSIGAGMDLVLVSCGRLRANGGPGGEHRLSDGRLRIRELPGRTWSRRPP